MRGVSPSLERLPRRPNRQNVKRRAVTPHPSASGAHLLPQGEKDQAASWKIRPSVIRLPARTVLTPWRIWTR